MMKSKISKVLCPLVLSSSIGFSSNATVNVNKTVTRINNKKLYTVENEVEVVNTKTSYNESNSSFQVPFTFEDKWVSMVKKIIESSIESNKNDLKTNGVVGSDSPGFCYSGDGFGGMIYSEGFTSFADFKREIFRTILRTFLEKRLKKLVSIIPENGLHDPKVISTACEEVKKIVQIFADNSFDTIISNFVDLNSINIPMKIVCVNS